MKCSTDKKYVYADGRKLIFIYLKDRQYYEERRRNIEVACGKYESRVKK